MLNVTDIRVRPSEKATGKLRALVSLIIDDCFAVHDIKIISGKGGVPSPTRTAPSATSYIPSIHPPAPKYAAWCSTPTKNTSPPFPATTNNDLLRGNSSPSKPELGTH